MPRPPYANGAGMSRATGRQRTDLIDGRGPRLIVLCRDNTAGVHQGSTRLSSRVIESHLESRRFGTD
jgi:hypothetical protein